MRERERETHLPGSGRMLACQGGSTCIAIAGCAAARLEQHLALQSTLFDHICDPRGLAADAQWNGRRRLLRQVWALRLETDRALIGLVHTLQVAACPYSPREPLPR